MRILSRQKNEAELDKALAAAEAGPTGQMLRGLARELAPDSRFAGALDASLRALVSREAARTNHPVRGTLTWPPHPRRALAFAGMVLVLTLTLVAVFSVARPKPVSAAEILARMGSVNGWRTLHMKWASSALVGPNQRTSATNEGWFLAPGKYRLEDNVLTPEGESFPVTIVGDGQTAWLSDGQNNLVYLQDSEPDLPRMFQMSYEDTLALGQDAGFQVTRLADETVAGRPAYVLDVTRSPGAGGPSHLRAWIDKEYYVCLREESWGAGGVVIASGQLSLLEANAPLSDTLFSVVPPAGHTVIDARTVPADGQERTDLWQSAARQARYSVFIPQDIGAFGPAGRPYYDPSRRVVTMPFGSPPMVLSLYMEQGPADVLRLPGPGHPITAGALEGEYVAQGHWVTLSFERSGTRVLLHAYFGGAAAHVEPRVRQIIQVAQSLVPVGQN